MHGGEYDDTREESGEAEGGGDPLCLHPARGAQPQARTPCLASIPIDTATSSSPSTAPSCIGGGKGEARGAWARVRNASGICAVLFPVHPLRGRDKAGSPRLCPRTHHPHTSCGAKVWQAAATSCEAKAWQAVATTLFFDVIALSSTRVHRDAGWTYKKYEKAEGKDEEKEEEEKEK